MLLADVCGYGPVFAEIAAGLRDLMIRNINSIGQTRLVSHMSRRLEGASTQGGFASALVTTYFAPTRSFSLCNAGHPPPLLFRAETKQWSVLKQSSDNAADASVPLGVVDPQDYQSVTTSLGRGDLVLCYSEPLAECCDSSGRVLGTDGFLQMARKLDTERPGEFVSNLLAELRGSDSDLLADMDATLVLCRATETPVSWQDNLLAPLRLLRRAADNTCID